MDVTVKDKVVVITGAGGGIGRATALCFAASGGAAMEVPASHAGYARPAPRR